MSKLVQINIDWADEFGWHCSLCGGEIDHLDEERNNEEGYSDDTYRCVDKGGDLCDRAYFMVRWSHKQRGDNGDSLTLKRWLEVEFKDGELEGVQSEVS